MQKRHYFLGLALALILSSCAKDEETPMMNTLDAELNLALEEASNGQGKAHFILPKSNDFNNIPQDPKNPISPVKV